LFSRKPDPLVSSLLSPKMPRNMPTAVEHGIDTRKLIQQYNIELVHFTTITKSPSDYYGAWNTQFIILDVLDWLKEHVDDDDNIFILDSDIIFNKPLSPDIVNELRDHKALLYSIDYAHNHKINGLTRSELASIAKDLYDEFPANDFIYSGGEFVCCLGSEVVKIAELGRKYYLLCLERHKKMLPKFNEEAHLLSFVYTLLGYKTHTANQFIKRIWTNRRYFSNIDGKESDLILWHLPAEKNRGFLRVFRSYRFIEGTYQLTMKNFRQAYGIEETSLAKISRYGKQYILPQYQSVRRALSGFYARFRDL